MKSAPGIGLRDLIQAAFSFSLEDPENKYLPLYTQSEVLQDNPFAVLDEKIVGKLMAPAVKWGRSERVSDPGFQAQRVRQQ